MRICLVLTAKANHLRSVAVRCDAGCYRVHDVTARMTFMSWASCWWRLWPDWLVVAVTDLVHADARTVIVILWFFRVANANSFLSQNQMKITSFSSWVSHGGLHSQFFSRRLFKRFRPRSLWKKWSIQHRIVLFGMLNNKFVADLIGLTLYRMVMPIGTPFLKEKINN